MPPAALRGGPIHSRPVTGNAEPGRYDGPVDPAIPHEWIEEFESAARQPLEVRMRNAFVRVYEPVMDDAPYRSFETMADYHRWCEEHLPPWLGYGRAPLSPADQARREEFLRSQRPPPPARE